MLNKYFLLKNRIWNGTAEYYEDFKEIRFFTGSISHCKVRYSETARYGRKIKFYTT